MTQVKPPFFLFHSEAQCWSCGTQMPVRMLAAVSYDGNDGEASDDWQRDVATLEYIKSLPPELDEYMSSRFDDYLPFFSKTVQDWYFANICPSCGANYGDFYLSSPNGPFFREPDLVGSTTLKYERLPLAGELEVDAAPSWGIAEVVFAYGEEMSP